MRMGTARARRVGAAVTAAGRVRGAGPGCGAAGRGRGRRPRAPVGPVEVFLGSLVTLESYFQAGWRSIRHWAHEGRAFFTGTRQVHNGPMDHTTPLEQALHVARALVLADLAAGEVADADVVSLVEDSVTHRRWWVEQWPEGADYLPGLVAQDVQDSLLEKYGRWPLCPVCTHGDPHALDVEPELGPDPHWVCSEAGVRVAAVGGLGPVLGLR